MFRKQKYMHLPVYYKSVVNILHSRPCVKSGICMLNYGCP